MPPVLVLVGPTASGKTSLSIELAQRFPLEIVNLDASQLYAGMDIGTAKPTAEERGEVPHHLFDVSTPDRPLNAGAYAELADGVIAEVLSRDRWPLLVGGTGLYARALLFGLARIPEVPSGIRDAINARIQRDGTAAVHARLAEVDPVTARRIPRGDTQRISRALEVFEATGIPISRYQDEHRFAAPRYRYLKLCVSWPRTVLRQRIVDRVPRMFEAGFVREVEGLLSAGYPPGLRTFKALGYREVIDHLAGCSSLPECIERVTTRHLQYAKRQETWFSGETDSVRLEAPFGPAARASVEGFLGRGHVHVQ